MNSKIIIATLAGGVAYFFLGWLVYGVLLQDFMMANYDQCANRPMEDFVWWAMICSNLASAYLLALIFGWTNTTDFMGGAIKGAIIGALVAVSFDLSAHAMTTMFVHARAMPVDALAGAFTTGIVGGVVAMMLGRGKTAS